MLANNKCVLTLIGSQINEKSPSYFLILLLISLVRKHEALIYFDFLERFGMMNCGRLIESRMELRFENACAWGLFVIFQITAHKPLLQHINKGKVNFFYLSLL